MLDSAQRDFKAGILSIFKNINDERRIIFTFLSVCVLGGGGCFPVAQQVKNLPAVQETWEIQV